MPRRTLLRHAPLVAALLLAVACGGDRAEPPRKAPPKAADLPTEDVAPPPDARVDLTRDRQEHRKAETFSGVLPGGFPKTLPLPPQASLVDQGPGWVELLVPRHPAEVQAPYLDLLRRHGWTLEPAGERAWSVRHDATRVRLEIRAQGPSTRLRLAY